MPQVVTAENLIEFTQTGKAPEFKPPEPAQADAEPKKETPAIPARDEAGKFTKQSEDAKSEPASEAPASPKKKEIDDEDLPEVVRRKIDKKHRQMKEAEEFARSEALRALAAERRAEQLERELEAYRKKSGPAPVQTEAHSEPKPEDFATVAEYTDALVRYRVEQTLREERAKAAHEAAEREKAERARTFGERLNAAKSKYDDFEDVLTSIRGTDLDRVHADVTEYIQESEHGPDLLYHLAKHPDVLDRLRKLSPRRFIAELGKLEAKWEEQTPPAKEETPTLSDVATPAKRPVSKAPPPIAPLDTAGIAPVAKKPEEMTVAELREFRRQQEREKRARA
ncbi:MAG: hypothetical protein IRZ07_00820 [Microbispora sp.]|nr:hypothetical protein [Microbispora sp.]